MDIRADKRDFKLLENDKYTFAVLSKILNHSCRLMQTDHERLIVCHSADPFPVWVWTPDSPSLEEKERAWQTVMQFCPLSDGYRYNLKYDLADFFLSKAKEQGIQAAVTMNLLAYDCPEPLAPKHTADGYLHLCTPDDLEEAADFIRLFHEETGIDQGSDAKNLSHARTLIEDRHLFFWKSPDNRAAASCSYTPTGDVTALSTVYTAPAYRRRHYAENLVYQVTKIVEHTGVTPMLYTDADYAASNACYEKIGYMLKGKLCTIGTGTL